MSTPHRQHSGHGGLSNPGRWPFTGIPSQPVAGPVSIPPSVSPRRLYNIQLLLPNGTFQYSWSDKKGNEALERLELNSVIGILDGKIVAGGSGFFSSPLVRKVALDTSRPWMMLYEARMDLDTDWYRCYSFDLCQLLYIKDGYDIGQKTLAMLEATIPPDSTTTHATETISALAPQATPIPSSQHEPPQSTAQSLRQQLDDAERTYSSDRRRLVNKIAEVQMQLRTANREKQALTSRVAFLEEALGITGGDGSSGPASS